MTNDNQTFNFTHWHHKSTIKVLMIGTGGTGSALLTELYQLNVILENLSLPTLELHIYDGDIVTQSNTGRQSFWLHDIGQNKATTLVDRFNTYGHAYMTAYPHEYDVNTHCLHEDCDLIITCVDNVGLRKAIFEYQQQVHQSGKKQFWLDTGNDRSQGQVVMGTIGNHKMTLPSVGDLYPSLMTAKDNNVDSCSHEQAIAKQTFGINKKVALEAASLIWQLCRYHKLSRHGSIIDIEAGYTTPILINETAWAMMGYQPTSNPVEVTD